MSIFRRTPQISEIPSLFLSFRGADTRDNIVSLTYDNLVRQGFNVFLDDQKIRIGHDIDESIRMAIQNSSGAVIFFSKNYAQSRWCLEELQYILARKRELGSRYILQPVYLDGLDPNDVGNQTKSFGTELAIHKWNSSFLNFQSKFNTREKRQLKKKVKLWEAALTEVADYRGMCLKGKWSDFIYELVEEIRQQYLVELGIIVKPSEVDNGYGMLMITKLTTIATRLYENRLLLSLIMVIYFTQPQYHLFRQAYAFGGKKIQEDLLPL